MRGMDTRVNGLSHKVTEDTDDVTVEQIVDSHGKVLNEVIRLNGLVSYQFINTLYTNIYFYLFVAVLLWTFNARNHTPLRWIFKHKMSLFFCMVLLFLLFNVCDMQLNKI